MTTPSKPSSAAMKVRMTKSPAFRIRPRLSLAPPSVARPVPPALAAVLMVAAPPRGRWSSGRRLASPEQQVQSDDHGQGECGERVRALVPGRLAVVLVVE